MATKFTVTLLSLLLAGALWSIVFLLHPFDFWISLSTATAILLIFSLYVNGSSIKRSDISARIIVYGLASGLLLYCVFYLGFELIKYAPFMAEGVNSVYALGANRSPIFIGILLLFPIAPGEETYWRGLVQRRFIEKMGTAPGIFMAAAAYSLVHLPTLNPMLMFTAFIGGIYWGLVYWRTKSLVPVIVSHATWDLLIFVILPLT